MLSRAHKLSSADLREVLKTNRSYHSPSLSLKIHTTDDLSEPSRFAFVVPKSVAKSAVLRNSLRRKGYSSLHKVINKVKPSHYGVFMARKEFKNITPRERDEVVLSLLKKSGVID